jgi:hypothetical protein
MKIYGLFKVINKGSTNYEGVNLFNLLHPDQRIEENGLDLEPKTFFDFFFEDNDAVKIAGVDIQYDEYNKFKRELEQMVCKKTISQFDRDTIAKMLQRIITAENKFLKYKRHADKIDCIEANNQNIIDRLFSSQSKYAMDINKFIDLYHDYVDLGVTDDEIPGNLKLLLDLDEIRGCNYEDTIMYPLSAISFYRTGVRCVSCKVILDNEDGRVEYVAFDLEGDEAIKSVNIKRVQWHDDKVSKLEALAKLCEELSVPLPKEAMVPQYINYKYNGRKLIILPVSSKDREIEYELVNI